MMLRVVIGAGRMRCGFVWPLRGRLSVHLAGIAGFVGDLIAVAIRLGMGKDFTGVAHDN